MITKNWVPPFRPSHVFWRWDSERGGGEEGGGGDLVVYINILLE